MEQGQGLSREGGNRRVYTKEDVLAATTPGGALEAYRRASRDSGGFSLVELQTATADALHTLGDEEGSRDFTLLAAQTRNVERNVRVADELIQALGGVESVQKRFRSDLENFSHSSIKVIESAGERFDLLGRRMSRLGDDIEKGSGKMDEASRRIDDAAGQIDRASRRMNP